MLACQVPRACRLRLGSRGCAPGAAPPGRPACRRSRLPAALALVGGGLGLRLAQRAGRWARRGRGAWAPRRASGAGTPAIAVVGLGNVGMGADGTRHNVGFDAVDAVAAALAGGRPGAEEPRPRWELAEGRPWADAHGGSLLTLRPCQGAEGDGLAEVLLFKPASGMNRSGVPVAELLLARGVAADRLVVVYDDLDTDVGLVRFRRSGGAGGQKGVKSILERGITDFLRVRVGISRPRKIAGMELVRYVLGQFLPEERTLVSGALQVTGVEPIPSL